MDNIDSNANLTFGNQINWRFSLTVFENNCLPSHFHQSFPFRNIQHTIIFPTENLHNLISKLPIKYLPNH